MAAAGRALRRAASVYVVAGCAFAVVATVLVFWLSDLDYAPVRAAALFWGWAWPVVLVLGLLWSRDRTRITLVLGVYFGGLLLICAVVAARDTPAFDLLAVSMPAFFQPLFVWAYTIQDTVFLLLFLNRWVRSVGPVLFVFMLIASIGGVLGKVVTSMYAVILAQVVFVLPAWWVIGGIRRAY